MIEFVQKNYHNFKSHPNVLNNLCFFNFLYYKTQFFFVWCVHYTPFKWGKICLKISKFEKYFEFIKYSNSILLNYEWFFNVGNRLLLDFSFYHHFFLKDFFVYSFAKLTHLTQLLFTFNFVFYDNQISILNSMEFSFEFLKTQINHLTWFGIINITLHYHEKTCK